MDVLHGVCSYVLCVYECVHGWLAGCMTVYARVFVSVYAVDKKLYKMIYLLFPISFNRAM